MPIHKTLPFLPYTYPIIFYEIYGVQFVNDVKILKSMNIQTFIYRNIKPNICSFNLSVGNILIYRINLRYFVRANLWGAITKHPEFEKYFVFQYIIMFNHV